MVRTCQAEESVSTYFDALIQQRLPAQVGLLVGKQAVGSRDLLLAVIRTPAQDGQEPVQYTSSQPASTAAFKGAKKPSVSSKGAASSVNVHLETEWISEHATQVARMLPGGLSVLGVYLFCPEAGYQSAVPQLCTILSALWDISPPAQDADGKPGELLLLHADSGSRKQSLRCVGQGAAPALLKPCELKTGPSMSNLVCLTCRYNVDVSLPVPSTADQLQQQLNALLSSESSRVRSAVMALGPTIPSEDQLVIDAVANPSKPPGGMPTASVQLLCPLHNDAMCETGPTSSSSSSSSSSQVQGMVTLRGTLEGVAYIHKREPMKRATLAVTADLLSTLQARVDLLIEDALAWAEEQQQQQQQQQGQGRQQQQQQKASSASSQPADSAGNAAHATLHPLLRQGPLSKDCSYALPRRVLLPWKEGLKLCDYLMHDEDTAAAADRAQELLDLVLEDASQVEVCEAVGSSTKTVAPWQPQTIKAQVAGPPPSKAGTSSIAPASSICSMALLTFAGVVVAAIAVGLGYFMIGQ